MPAAAVNASPLIFLAKLDRLEALRVFSPVLTTQVVLGEVEAGLESGHADALAVRREVAEGRIRVRRAPPLSLPGLDLDPGEFSTLALANSVEAAFAIVDDLAAIRAARHLRIPVRSTPFVLLDNVRAGRIRSAEFRTLLDRLMSMDYRLGPALYVKLLDEAASLGRTGE